MPNRPTYKMDATKENQYIFNWKLAKYMGIYQILNPETVKIFGYNVYHVFAFFGVLCLSSISMLCPFGMVQLIKEENFFTFYLGCVINLLFSCYKMIIIAYHSKDIWDCIDVTSLNLLSYHHYDRNIFRNWRKRSIRTSYISIVSTMLAFCFWILSPIVFHNTIMTIKHDDGSSSNYRMNIFNMYIFASDVTYNKYFNTFFFIEIILAVWYFYFTIIFEVLMVMMCSALSCQLETISSRINLLGHDICSSGVHLGTLSF